MFSSTVSTFFHPIHPYRFSHQIIATLSSTVYSFVYLSIHSSVLFEKEEFSIRFLRTPFDVEHIFTAEFPMLLMSFMLFACGIQSTYIKPTSLKIKSIQEIGFGWSELRNVI
jgi:hypothetical protein